MPLPAANKHKERPVFGREKQPVPLDRIEVTVGPTANFNGDLVCDGIVKIDGIFQGSIKTVSNVIISEKARVDANIEAQNISVSGHTVFCLAVSSTLTSDRLPSATCIACPSTRGASTSCARRSRGSSPRARWSRWSRGTGPR